MTYTEDIHRQRIIHTFRRSDLLAIFATDHDGHIRAFVRRTIRKKVKAKFRFIAQFEICTSSLPLPLGEVPRRGGEGKWHHRHPLNFRDYESITKSFVGNGLVPFRRMHHRHPYEFRFIEQTEGMVGVKASP